MLREAGEPGGIPLDEGWLWRRWVARMASVLTLADAATALGWGLRRLRPWARWALIALWAAPPVALVAALVFQAGDGAKYLRGLGGIMPMPGLGVALIPAIVAACWATCSRRGRAVRGFRFGGVIARTPKLSPTAVTGLLPGLGLAAAMIVLWWTLLMIFLGALETVGAIRSI